MKFDLLGEEFKSETLLFEPDSLGLNNGMMARSNHLNSNENLFCNLVNAGDVDLKIEANTKMGTVCEVELANERFEEAVSKFKPLDLNKLKSNAKNRANAEFQFGSVSKSLLTGNSGYSKPFHYDSNDITTADIQNHQINQLVKSILTGKTRTPEERAYMLEVIHENIEAFQWKGNDLGRTNLVEHDIPTGDHRPIVQKQFPLPSIAKEECSKQVNRMLALGVISPSFSSWRSPVLLVKKKTSDGSIAYRFCIDLKKVNDITAKDCYSLPIISETVDCLAGSQYFSTMDVDQAFWQIGVRAEDRKKLAFVIDGKLFEFNVMPFGSMNAPSTFQRLIDRVLRGLTWKQCLVYIDDVLIFSKTFEQHLRDVDEILKRFRAAGLKLKPTKCLFADDEVEYLGFKISRKGIQASTKRIESILNLDPPETNKKLYRFLCSMNYYRMLIPKFGDLTAKLYKMAEAKARVCNWSDETTAMFHALKHALISAPILSFPDFNLPFVVHSDASAIAVAAVLLQLHAKLFCPVAFCSSKLDQTKQRYSATERELFAITYANQQFRHFILGRKVIFYTDHMPLVTMAKLKSPLGRLGRLFHALSHMDYKLEHIRGIENHLPDFLSRSFMDDSKEIRANTIQLVSTVDWKLEQSKDPELSLLLLLIRNDAANSEWKRLPNSNRWLNEKKNLYIDLGILKHGKDTIVCPQHMKNSVCAIHHDSPMAGHRGADTTLKSISRLYYWNFQPSEVTAYCRSCVQCQTFNYSNHTGVAPLRPIEVTRPMQLIGIDLMGPFVKTALGNIFVILAIDHFTKFVTGMALASFTAEITAQFIFNEIICKFGMVEKIISDQGVNFEAFLMKHLCELLLTKKLRVTTYHGMGNGTIERLNKTVKPNLAKFVAAEHDNWDVYLQMAISAYNNSFHASIQMTPYEAFFGRPSVSVAEVIMNSQLPADTKIRNVADFIIKLRQSAYKINKILAENIKAAQATQKQYYDRFVNEKIKFAVGDLVKINNVRKQVGHSKAFEKKFIGPYQIMNIIDGITYQLVSPFGLKPETVHFNRLYKWVRRLEDPTEVQIVVSPSAQPASPQEQFQELPIIFNQTLIEYRDLVRRRNSKLLSAEQRAQQILDMEESIEAVLNQPLDRDQFISPIHSNVIPLEILINQKNLQAGASFRPNITSFYAVRMELQAAIVNNQLHSQRPLAIEAAPPTLRLNDTQFYLTEDEDSGESESQDSDFEPDQDVLNQLNQALVEEPDLDQPIQSPKQYNLRRVPAQLALPTLAALQTTAQKEATAIEQTANCILCGKAHKNSKAGAAQHRRHCEYPQVSLGGLGGV